MVAMCLIVSKMYITTKSTEKTIKYTPVPFMQKKTRSYKYQSTADKVYKAENCSPRPVHVNYVPRKHIN